MYNYDYNYDYNVDSLFNNIEKSSESLGAFAGLWTLLIGMIWLVIIVGLLITIWRIVYRWVLFTKAGKNGWEAIIPVYSSWTLYEVSGFPGWFCFIGFASFIPFVKYVVPFVYLAIGIVTSMSICKKFNKSGAFWVLVWLLPDIGLPILAFGKDKYDKTKGEQKNIQPIK